MRDYNFNHFRSGSQRIDEPKYKTWRHSHFGCQQHLDDGVEVAQLDVVDEASAVADCRYDAVEVLFTHERRPGGVALAVEGQPLPLGRERTGAQASPQAR